MPPRVQKKHMKVVIDCCDGLLKRLTRERPRASRRGLALRLLREHVDGRSHREGCKGTIVLIFGDDHTGEDYEQTFPSHRAARAALADRIRTVLLKGQGRLRGLYVNHRDLN